MALNRPKDVIRKSGGGLVSVTQETAQQLGQDVGVPAVTSPLQGSTVGANADQAKMLGTPANLRSAIRARTAPQETLDTALRTQQFEREATEDERTKQARLDQFFANVPGIAQLDEELAKAVKNSLMPGVDASQQILGVDWDAIQGFFGDQVPDLAALQSVAQDVIDPTTGAVTEKSLLTKALQGDQLTDAQVNQLTAALEANGLKLEDIKNFVVSPQDQLAEQILNSRATEIRIGDIPQEALDKLGLDNDYLTQLFGTDANGQPMWKGATYQDVKNHIQELQATFSDVRDLQRIANDPFSSASMRREANKRLRELGHLGKRAAMEKVNDLEKQIEDGDTVQIGDATFEIEEILDDDDWQEAIYLAMNDEKAMESLQENNPELAEWIQTNKQALDRQFTTISGRLAPGQNLKDLMVSEEEIEELDVGYVDFDPAFAQSVITDLYGETTSWETMTPSQKMEATTEIDARLQGNWDELMTGIDPSFYADRGLDIMNMSPEEMETAAADIRTEFNTQEFNDSGYAAQFDEYKELAAELGLPEPTMPTANEWAALPPEERDLTKKIDDLKGQIENRRIDNENEAVVSRFSSLSEGTRELLGISYEPGSGKSIELSPNAIFVEEFLGGLSEREKITASETINHIISSNLTDADGFVASNYLSQFMESNRAALRNTLPSVLKEQFDKRMKTRSAAFPEGIQNFDEGQMFSLLFPELGGNAEAISYLRSKSFTEYPIKRDSRGMPIRNRWGKIVRDETAQPVSALPRVLDQNQDGMLDSTADLMERLKGGLSSFDKDGLTVERLEQYGSSLTKLMDKDKAYQEAKQTQDAAVARAKESWEAEGGIGETAKFLESPGLQEWFGKNTVEGVDINLQQLEFFLGQYPGNMYAWSLLTPEKQRYYEDQLKKIAEGYNKRFEGMVRVDDTNRGAKSTSRVGQPCSNGRGKYVQLKDGSIACKVTFHS